MSSTWDLAAPGVVRLPSGRVVRGRSLRLAPPDGPAPDFAVYLVAEPPEPVAWDARWVNWPDFLLPRDHRDARAALIQAWRRAECERVEVGCSGGKGRTGTALACIAVLDGVSPGDAVAFVRANYHPGAVETPWQRRYVRQFHRA